MCAFTQTLSFTDTVLCRFARRFVLRKVLAEDTEGLSGAAVLQAIIDGHNEDALDTTEDEADAVSTNAMERSPARAQRCPASLRLST